jgi:membrane-associated HD superfamily phosphohydrolase
MTKTQNEILKEIMKGDSKNEDYETLKRMFPELFKVISDDIMKAISLTAKEKDEEMLKFLIDLQYDAYNRNHKIQNRIDELLNEVSKKAEVKRVKK